MLKEQRHKHPRFESHLCLFLAVWLWVCQLALLCLSFLICKVEMIIIALTSLWWLNEVTYSYVKCLEHWLAHRRPLLGLFLCLPPCFCKFEKLRHRKTKSFPQDCNAPFWWSLDTYPSHQTALNMSVIQHSSLLMDPGRYIVVCLNAEEEINSF